MVNKLTEERHEWGWRVAYPKQDREVSDEITRLRIALDAIKDSDNLEFIHLIAETALAK